MNIDYRIAFDLAPVGLALSRNRTIMDCNQRLCQMFGTTREQLIGQSFLVLYPSADEFERYIDYIADRRLVGCGLPELNPGIKNSLPWLAELMDIRKEQNFFEGKVTDYKKASSLTMGSDDEL